MKLEEFRARLDKKPDRGPYWPLGDLVEVHYKQIRPFIENGQCDPLVYVELVRRDCANMRHQCPEIMLRLTQEEMEERTMAEQPSQKRRIPATDPNGMDVVCAQPRAGINVQQPKSEPKDHGPPLNADDVVLGVGGDY